MADSKKYYWLKLKSDFFSSKRIKKLRRMAGGDTFTIIYLKMQLAAVKTDGILQWTGVEDNFAAELALDLDENVEDVQMTLMFLESCGLIETSDDVNYFLPYVIENTGSETGAAERMRKMRERNNVTPMLQERYTEIEREKEIEIDSEKEIEIKRTVSNETVCSTDVQRVIEAWNSLGLNRITRIVPDSQRAKWLRKRITDYGIEEVLRAINQIPQSKFLLGDNKNGWQVTFDWFIRPNNFPKVLDGNYLNDKQQPAKQVDRSFTPTVF